MGSNPMSGSSAAGTTSALSMGIRSGEYDQLPRHRDEPDTPMLGTMGRPQRAGAALSSVLTGGSNGSGSRGSSSGRSCCRPKFVATLVLVALVTVVLLPSGNRTAAHSALTKAGVPLPDTMPDRLHDFLDSWSFADDGSNDLAYVPPPPDPALLGDEKSEAERNCPHGFHPNGHLIVEPVATFPKPPKPHPILTLIQRAEHDWAHKVARQSTTLEAAVSEYRRRYKRNPPKGFDQWFNYAVQNRVVLTDEYDQIFKDLQPFWALEPSDLAHRVRVMQVREETFSIHVKDGQMAISGEQAALARARDLANLIKRFSSHVPDINMTFTRHDQPACQLDWYHKERMIELAELGEFFGPSDWVDEGHGQLTNWANGCPPDSPLRQIEQSVLNAKPKPREDQIPALFKKAYTTALAKKRSYIYDYQSALDICQHPEIMPIHGFTAAPGTDAGPLVPLFTFAKTNIHSDILVTPLEQYSDSYIGYDPDWDKKSYNKLMWRGSTTGAMFVVDEDWRASQRARLHFLTHELNGNRNVLVAHADEQIREEVMPMRNLNGAQMDVSFSGGPVQCDEETCALMHAEVDFKPTMGLSDSYQYKYVMDVDGNGWSGRFHRLMSMKACVFKSTLFPEWYGDRIQPWVHYVPIKVDYSDLYDAMTFFRGGPDGNNGHDELGKKIGTAGKEWARDHWRKQDMAAYMFRLSLEWARLLHRADGADPETLDFDFDY